MSTGTEDFAKLERFEGVGQALAVLEDNANGDPCVSLRVAAPEDGLIVRTEYTFPSDPEPEAAAAHFFASLDSSRIETLARALLEEAMRLLAEESQTP